MNEKRKNEASKPEFSRNAFFVFLWIALSLGIGSISQMLVDGSIILMNWLLELFQQGQANDWQSIIFSTLVLTGLSAVAQKIVIRLSFGQWIKGWISSSLFGMAFIQFLSSYLQENRLLSSYPIEPEASILLIVSAILMMSPNAWVLRRYVKHSWIFLLASIASILISATIMKQGINWVYVGIGLAAMIKALTLVLLFQQPVVHEKAKLDEAVSRLEDKSIDSPESEDIEERARKRKAKQQSLERLGFVIRLFRNWPDMLAKPKKG